jgi:4-amino-4-deoxy-L-arabinose transferase-like glycosyltransferase
MALILCIWNLGDGACGSHLPSRWKGISMGQQSVTQTAGGARITRMESAALVAILSLAAALRLWRLDQNGFGNMYYAAAVRSMLSSWRNFFYVSFDPTGVVSVDKPPVALWIQALSARLLGFNGIAVLLPQVLAGVASVALVYLLVRRAFGAGAGLTAAVVLAITPIAVAVDRTNNLDSILVLVLLAATFALLRATETGRVPPAVGCGILMGIAFNVKMLAAFVVLPTFVAIYYLSASRSRSTRLPGLAAAAGALLVTAFSWPLAVDLTPKAQRPYVGGSQTNSVIELALGYNGMGRLTGNEQRGPGGAPGGGMGQAGGPPPGFGFAGGVPGMTGGGPGPGGGGPGGRMSVSFGGQPGLMRLAQPGMADQVTWLFPLAIMGLIAALSRLRPCLPLTASSQQILLWGGWLATYSVVYSVARGIIHQYYLTTLGPPIAALVGIGVAAMWREYRLGEWRGWLLPGAFLLTSGWEAYILASYPTWNGYLHTPLLLGTLLAALALIIASPNAGGSRKQQRWAQGAALCGMVALMVAPTAWALTPVLSKGNSLMPAAGPNLLYGGSGPGFGGGPGESDPSATRGLAEFLHAHRGTERILLAMGSAPEAAPLIVQTGLPVVALGGFSGTDPVVSADGFAQMVADGKVRYVFTGGMGGGRPGGNNVAVQWVMEHGTPVSDTLWRSDSSKRSFGGPMGGRWGFGQLYDCSPTTRRSSEKTSRSTDNRAYQSEMVNGVDMKRGEN